MPLAQGTDHKECGVRSGECGIEWSAEWGWVLWYSAFRTPHSALRTETVRVAFFGGLFNTHGPTPEKQWPERYRAGNNEQAKSPRTVRRMGINPVHPNQSE